MAKLSGVKEIAESIEYNGDMYVKSDDAAANGDIVRIDNEYRVWFSRGGYYEVVYVDIDDDPCAYDEDGDCMPIFGDAEFTVFKRVSPASKTVKRHAKVGDYVRITGKRTPNAGGPHHFNIGDIAKVCKVLSDSVLCDRVTDDRRQRISPINYEIITEEEAKWAKIGRKVGEYKVGDLVRVVETYASGYPEGTVGEVVEQPPYWVGGKRTAVAHNGAVRDHTGDVELVTPVESRFDKSA